MHFLPRVPVSMQSGVPELAVAPERGSKGCPESEALGCATRLVVQTLGHPRKLASQ